MSSSCPSCGNKYERIELHLSKSSCPYPKYSNFQKQALTGLLMGDANIDYHSANNPRWRISMINKQFLQYLDRKFSKHTTDCGVQLQSTSEESYNSTKDSSIGHTVTDSNNYSDVYILRSYTSPNLKNFSLWYSSGKKEFPKEINLTPTVAKYWYVCDGSLRTKSENPYVSFGISNEINNKSKIESMFKNVGFDSLNFFKNSRSDGSINGIVQIRGKDESKRFLNYIGDPVPGFDYKWI